MKFYDFIKKFKGIDHPMGDFVEDIVHDKSFPKNVSSKKELLLYLDRKRACDACLECAYHSWDCYEIWEGRNSADRGREFINFMSTLYPDDAED